MEEAAECVLHYFSHLFEDSFFSIAIRKGVGDGLANKTMDPILEERKHPKILSYYEMEKNRLLSTDA